MTRTLGRVQGFLSYHLLLYFFRSCDFKHKSNQLYDQVSNPAYALTVAWESYLATIDMVLSEKKGETYPTLLHQDENQWFS